MPNQTSEPTPEQLNDPEGHKLVDAIHQRRELGNLILGRTTSSAVEKIWEAGFRKQRTVTTIAELNELNFEAVILDAYDTAYVCVKTISSNNEWSCPMTTLVDMDSWQIMDNGPFRVIHEGTK